MSVNRIRLSPTSWKVRNAAVAVGIAAVFLCSANMLELDIVKFITRLGNAGRVLSRFWAFDLSFLPEALWGMLTSVSIAVTSLFVGFIISIVMSFLAASNTTPNIYLAALIKGGVAVIRAVPFLVWILMIVVSIGFGNTSGLVGMLFPTCGFLIKSFTTSIEDKGNDSIEAMRSVGAGWFNVVVKGVLPGVIGVMLSWLSIRLESNIAESISLGMVGVGGIGLLLMRALGAYQFERITVIIVVIVAVLLLTENAVNVCKRKLINEEP